MFKNQEHAITKATIVLKNLNNKDSHFFNEESIETLKIMHTAFISYEENINNYLEALNRCNVTDYEMIDKNFFNIKIQVSMYLLDLKKLSLLWLIFFKQYCNSHNLKQPQSYKNNINFKTSTSIDILLLKITDTIKKFNKAGREKIIHIQQFRTLQEQTRRFCEDYINLSTDINTMLKQLSNKKDENNSLNMLHIIYSINDLVAELEFIHKALIKVVDYYNRKAY
jgi:hypothetical protein